MTIDARLKRGRSAFYAGKTLERDAEAFLAERRPEQELRANGSSTPPSCWKLSWIPRSLFSPRFGAQWLAGWCAHGNHGSPYGFETHYSARKHSRASVIPT